MLYQTNKKHRTECTPGNTKHKVNRLIASGKFTNHKVTKDQLKHTYHALQQKDPDAYYELSDYYLIYFNGKTLVTYSI